MRRRLALLLALGSALVVGLGTGPVAIAGPLN
jgi:hypothetical protein